jgi:hypothetical protein
MDALIAKLVDKNTRLASNQATDTGVTGNEAN